MFFCFRPANPTARKINSGESVEDVEPLMETTTRCLDNPIDVDVDLTVETSFLEDNVTRQNKKSNVDVIDLTVDTDNNDVDVDSDATIGIEEEEEECTSFNNLNKDTPIVYKLDFFNNFDSLKDDKASCSKNLF